MLGAAPVIDPKLTRELVLARSVVKTSSNAARLFVDTLKEQMADLEHSGIWTGKLLADTIARQNPVKANIATYPTPPLRPPSWEATK